MQIQLVDWELLGVCWRIFSISYSLRDKINRKGATCRIPNLTFLNFSSNINSVLCVCVCGGGGKMIIFMIYWNYKTRPLYLGKKFKFYFRSRLWFYSIQTHSQVPNNFSQYFNRFPGLGGSVRLVFGLPNNSYKPITNTAWVCALLCNLQKRVHSTRNHKW